MICQLCERKNIRKIKKIQGTDIFECKNCRLAFVDQTKKSKLDPQKEYNLEGYKENERQFRKRFRTIVETIHKYNKNGKVLDVGAGYGLLSSILYEKGYNIEIIEPMNSPYYLMDKKIKHHKIAIERFLSRCKTKYDVILLMDVIEHFEEPLKILSKLRSILNKKGILIIQTPNYKSLMARLCVDWSWWMVSDHKFFFSQQSIRLIFEKAGYTVSKLETFEDLQDFKKNLDGNFTEMQNPVVRKFVKGIFYIVFFPLYITLREILWKCYYGGLIMTIASPV